ncbi:hypothetical protein ACOME3_005156 [Neoechinorhynchus agilis]
MLFTLMIFRLLGWVLIIFFRRRDSAMYPSEWKTLAVKLIKQQVDEYQSDEAFFVVSLQDVCDKYIRWMMLMPRVKPFYAVKCNTDQVLLQLLSHLGLGFDCASKTEIQLISDLGVRPERIRPQFSFGHKHQGYFGTLINALSVYFC